MDQNSETVQQQLRRSPVGFLMVYVPVSEKKSFSLTQKMSKSPKNSSFCRFFTLFCIIFEKIGKLDGSKHSEVIESDM